VLGSEASKTYTLKISQILEALYFKVVFTCFRSVEALDEAV